MAKVDCVMCKADGDKTPASFVGTVEGKPAHYCLPCAGTMRRSGFFMERMGSEPKVGHKSYKRLTDAEKSEIVASHKSMRVLAERYDVSEQTVRNVRKRVDEQALATAVAEQGPEAVEEAVEVPEEMRSRDIHQGVVNGAIHEGKIEDCMACGSSALRRAPAPVPAFFMPEEEPVEDVEGCACSCHRIPLTKACQDCWRHHPDSKSYAYYSAKEKQPEPATARITLDLTHATANAIWGGLTLEEKATFCRTKIIERLMELA